jgi:hypothetical protein
MHTTDALSAAIKDSHTPEDVRERILKLASAITKKGIETLADCAIREDLLMPTDNKALDTLDKELDRESLIVSWIAGRPEDIQKRVLLAPKAACVKLVASGLQSWSTMENFEASLRQMTDDLSERERKKTNTDSIRLQQMINNGQATKDASERHFLQCITRSRLSQGLPKRGLGLALHAAFLFLAGSHQSDVLLRSIEEFMRLVTTSTNDKGHLSAQPLMAYLNKPPPDTADMLRVLCANRASPDQKVGSSFEEFEQSAMAACIELGEATCLETLLTVYGDQKIRVVCLEFLLSCIFEMNTISHQKREKTDFIALFDKVSTQPQNRDKQNISCMISMLIKTKKHADEVVTSLFQLYAGGFGAYATAIKGNYTNAQVLAKALVVILQRCQDRGVDLTAVQADLTLFGGESRLLCSDIVRISLLDRVLQEKVPSQALVVFLLDQKTPVLAGVDVWSRMGRTMFVGLKTITAFQQQQRIRCSCCCPIVGSGRA